MRPTFRQLEYLVAIDETGRFSSAAHSMHVSQPSLSAQVAEATPTISTYSSLICMVTEPAR